MAGLQIGYTRPGIGDFPSAIARVGLLSWDAHNRRGLLVFDVWKDLTTADAFLNDPTLEPVAQYPVAVEGAAFVTINTQVVTGQKTIFAAVFDWVVVNVPLFADAEVLP